MRHRTHRRRRAPLAALAALALLPVPAAGLQEASEAGAASAPTAPARPFLYELRGHGATAWLLGTVHLPDERVLALPDPVEQAFRAADAVYTEIETDLKAELAVARASQLPAGETLGGVVGEELAARVRERLVAAKLPGNAFDRFRPWAVTTALPMLEHLMAMATKPPLDKALYQRAKKEGKAVGGLETVEEQIGVFESLTAAEQVTLLRETLDQLDEYAAEQRDPIEETVQAWLSGDPARLLDLLEEGFGDDAALSAKVEEELVWKRNARLAERMAKLVQDDPARVAFFAVGALHLPDARLADDAPAEQREAQRGVLSLLREKGFEVRRVEARAPAAAAGDR